MRIGIVSDYYYPQLGGITEQVYAQASELASRGHEVSVITPKLVRVPRAAEKPVQRPELFEIVRAGRAYPFYINGSESLISGGFRLWRQLGTAYKAHDFDVVHVHNPFGIFLPQLGVLRSRARVTVGTVHSVVPKKYKPLRMFNRHLNNVFRNRLDARIAVSDAVVESMEPFFPGMSWEVIPNAIDTGFFSPEARPLPHLLGDKRNILFVGRFDPRNGLKDMIKAFTLLRERRDDVRLVVLGDGPMRPMHERSVPSWLKDDVLFEGRVDTLRPRYLASAEMLCTPCHLASFGMVLLEAMSAGLPIVASNISGFQLLVKDGEQGRLVEHDETGESFCNALDWMLNNRAEAQRMGAAARKRAEDAFSLGIVGDRLEDLYERLLDGAPVSRRGRRLSRRRGTLSV